MKLPIWTKELISWRNVAIVQKVKVSKSQKEILVSPMLQSAEKCTKFNWVFFWNMGRIQMSFWDSLTFRKYTVFLKFEKPLKFSSYHCCKYKLAVLGWTFVRFSYFNQSIACFIFEYFIIKLQMFNTNLNFRTSLTSSNRLLLDKPKRLDKPKSGHWFKFTYQLFKP